MSVETQLRELAEAASAEQRPVTAEEAIAHTAHADFLDDQSPRRGWALVAATIALLIGGLVVLLAWDRTPDDEPPRLASMSPGVTMPFLT